MNGGRGMPDVSLTPATEEKLAIEAKAEEKQSENEIFSKPASKPNKKLVIKPTEDLKPVKVLDDISEELASEPAKKPKKKLTEKQLEALARGRQKSIETRQKAKDKQQQFVYQEPKPIAPPVASSMSAPPNIQIDYDKIINGVASVYEQRLNAKEQKKLEDEQRAQAVNEQVSEFEEKIRADERLRLQTKIKEEQKIKQNNINTKMTENVYGRGGGMNAGASASANPYAYAFAMGARNRFQSRY
jgi:hypothetical protein